MANKMNLSAPKVTTWWLALVLGMLGLLGYFVVIPMVTANAFWLVAIAFVLLVLATLLEGL